MKEARTLLNVLSTRPTLLLAAVAMLGMAILALDVPQGPPDREIVAAWPVATGGYIVAFGMNHLARSPFLWGALLLAGLHLVARRVRNPKSPHRLGVPEAILALLLLAALAITAATVQPLDQPDRTRLRVQMAGADGRQTAQIVEEGAAYRLSATDGDRTLLFGSASTGPYAVESRPNGALRIHLPMQESPGTKPDLQVFARRPLAHPAPERPAQAPWGVLLTTLMMVVAASWLLVLATRNLLRTPPGERTGPLIGLVLIGLFVLANPWSGPGTGMFPLGAGTAGGSVLHRLVVQGNADVAPWTAVLPAQIHLESFRIMARIAAALGVLTVLVLGISTRRQARLPLPSKTLVLATGLVFSLAGLILLAHGLLRIPLPVAADELARNFATDLLPRIPARLSVLSATLTHGGPYTMTPWSGLLPGLGLAGFGVTLAALGHARTPTRKSASPQRPALLALVVAALLRAAVAWWFPGSLASPAAAAPVALVVACLGLLALAADDPRTGTDRGLGLVTFAAAALPFVLLP